MSIRVYSRSTLQGLGDHNFCRNPDNDTRPWCWVNVEENKFGFCDLQPCSNISRSPVTPATTATVTPELGIRSRKILDNNVGHFRISEIVVGIC